MRNKILIAVLIQLLILLSIIAYKQNMFSTGEEIILPTLPSSPRATVKGDYVNLVYEFSSMNAGKLGSKEAFKINDTVYVTLRKNAYGAFSPAALGTTQPKGELFIRGRVTNSDFDFTYVVTVKDDAGQEHDFEDPMRLFAQTDTYRENTHYLFCVDKIGRLISHAASGNTPGTFFRCTGGLDSVYGTVEKKGRHEFMLVRADYGIEKFFVEEGHPLNIKPGDNIGAVVSLAKNGNAVLKRLMVNGKDL